MDREYANNLLFQKSGILLNVCVLRKIIKSFRKYIVFVFHATLPHSAFVVGRHLQNFESIKSFFYSG